MKISRQTDLISFTKTHIEYVRRVATHKLKLIAGENLLDVNDGLPSYNDMVKGDLSDAEVAIARQVDNIDYVTGISISGLHIKDRVLTADVTLFTEDDSVTLHISLCYNNIMKVD